MQFNADKCFTMRTGRSKSKINASYSLHDQPLQSADSVKYLGLTLTSDLKFNFYINNVTAKANSVLGLLRRNLTQAQQSLVRPHLEYASTVWSPHTSDNIKKVDMVQRRAASRWHNTSSVSEMVSHLGWESLAVRRSDMRLHTVYRIVHTTMGDPWQRWLTLSTRQTRGFHPWRYIPLSQSNDPYKFSFVPCTIPVWNSLPLHVVFSPTLDSFRLRLNNM